MTDLHHQWRPVPRPLVGASVKCVHCARIGSVLDEEMPEQAGLCPVRVERAMDELRERAEKAEGELLECWVHCTGVIPTAAGGPDDEPGGVPAVVRKMRLLLLRLVRILSERAAAMQRAADQVAALKAALAVAERKITALQDGADTKRKAARKPPAKKATAKT